MPEASSTSSCHENVVGGSDILQSMELEEGELVEGIEANDVSTLLEQFLEYEEKQGSLDCLPTFNFLSSEKSTSDSTEHTIALKISSFAESHGIDFILSHETKDNATDSLVKKTSENPASSVDGQSLQLDDGLDNERSKNDSEKHLERSKSEKERHVDNHATDHNYACCGFPLRKASLNNVKINGNSTQTGTNPSSRKSLALDVEHENEKKCSDETEVFLARKRQPSHDKDSADKKSRIPKRYRGPYCEDSSDEGSSCDEDKHHRRRRSHREEKSHYRREHKRKGSYSSDEENCYKRSKRRHSLYSSHSSDERNTSSDEDSKNEQRSRYDPRQHKSNYYRYSNGSDRDSSGADGYHERKRSRKQEYSEKAISDRKDITCHDIELERKMGFKFDQNIKGTGKEERRIVYIGKISNTTTKDDVWRRFRPFGPIEKVTVHFRDEGDNYAFVTFFEYSSAAEAIERGNEDPSLPVLDICFGGRRKFCGGSYVDFDSNTSYLEERELSRPPSSDEMDFDALLRLSQKNLKSRKELGEER